MTHPSLQAQAARRLPLRDRSDEAGRRGAPADTPRCVARARIRYCDADGAWTNEVHTPQGFWSHEIAAAFARSLHLTRGAWLRSVGTEDSHARTRGFAVEWLDVLNPTGGSGE